MLEQCIELFVALGRMDVSQPLQQALSMPSLSRPPDHRGPAETHMFRLQMSPAQAAVALALIRRAQDSSITTGATVVRGLGGFEQAWQDYIEYGESCVHAEGSDC